MAGLKIFIYLDGAFRFGIILAFIAWSLTALLYRFVIKKNLQPTGIVIIAMAFFVGAAAGALYYGILDPVVLQ